MKKRYILIVFVIILVSCNTFKYNVSSPINHTSFLCPENGTCTFELIPNKTITFKLDKFRNFYLEISEAQKNILKNS